MRVGKECGRRYIYILGSRVGSKFKIQSETRDFNFWGHSEPSI